MNPGRFFIFLKSKTKPQTNATHKTTKESPLKKHVKYVDTGRNTVRILQCNNIVTGDTEAEKEEQLFVVAFGNAGTRRKEKQNEFDFIIFIIIERCDVV